MHEAKNMLHYTLEHNSKNALFFQPVLNVNVHKLRYHIIDVPGVLENSVLGAYNCLSTLIKCIEQS